MGCLVLALSALQTTCRVDQLISPSTAAIRLTVAADTVGIADTARLVAIVTVDGKQNRVLRVGWTTDAPALATVDSLGVVRGVARGTATITARVENALFMAAPLTVSAAVRVVVPRLDLSASDTILTSVGDTVCLTPTAKDVQGTVLPGLTPDSLRPDSVFTPGATAACFVASRRSGPVAFRAWLDIAQATKFVRVTPVAVTLAVTPDSLRFSSRTAQRTPAVAAVDRRGNAIVSPSIVWTSLNDTVVTVGASGVITALGNGATWVRAADTAGAGRDSVYIAVRQEARRVVVTPEADTLTSVGARRPLQATARDSLGQPIADAAFSWSSLAPNTVRLVADSGARAVFEAATEGSASIDVRSAAGGKVADTVARLEVRFALTAVTIAPTRPTLSHVRDTLRFSATGRDANNATIANLRVTWTSSAPTRISIDPVSGLATARDAGSALITGRHDSGMQDTTTATVAPPVLQTDVAIFSDSAVRGSTTLVSQPRSVRDSGTVPLGAKARRVRSSSWLSISPDTVDLLAGESKFLTLSANPTGLADGLYSDTVVLDAAGAAGSPDTIRVTFRIYCPVTAITPDAVVAGSLASGDCLARHRPSGNADFYGFSGNAGDTITTTLSVGGGAGLDPFLFLLGPTGAVLISNDDCSPTTRNSCITGFVLPATGSYTLEATTFSPATGAYTLTLSRLATPAAPTTLAQLNPNGTAIPSGQTTAFTSAIFQATGQDANPYDTLRLQIELRPVSVAFSAPTDTGPPTPNAPGVTLSASAALTNGTSYHWRARTCDQTSRCGSWTAFPATPAFSVAVTGPVLTVTPDAIRDSALAGSTAPIKRILTIANTASGTITWNVTKRSTWLSLGAITGSAPPSATDTLTLSPIGLAAGVYVDTVIVNGGAVLGSPDTTFVTFVIQAPPVLAVSPAAINRAANANSGVTFNDTLGISNSGTGALAWTATVDSAWVVLSKLNGSAPDKLPLTITPGGRPAGTYRARVVISGPPGTAGSPDTTLVTLTVFQPVLAVNPASVTDSTNYGTTAPRDVTLQITNSAAGGTLTWSAAESPDTTWLSILPPSSGSAPGTVTLRLDPNPGGLLLAPGTHAGTVVFTSPEAINDPINIPVQFRVPRPILNVTPDSVFDTVTVSATAPRNIPVTIANGNGGVLAWTARDSAPTSSWLSLSPPSAGAPGTLTVTLNPLNLAGGVHRDTVFIRSDSATGSPRRLPIRFDVLRLPDPPTSLGQFRTAAGGGTEITPVGGVTTETSVVFKATVTDGDPGDALRLELQVEKVGTNFGATATAVSAPVASGQPASVTFGAPFADNTGYHWRVRTCDQTNRCSGWVSFGSNAETAADFSIAVPETPGLPTVLRQLHNGSDIAVGGGTGGGGILGTTETVTFQALVTDPDPGDLILIEVEFKDTGTAFNEQSLIRGARVSSNATASVSQDFQVPALGLGGQTNYHWRARACDQTGRCSGWVSFGGNSDTVPAATDFHVP
jgi:uncharacterized protein YjdB